MMWTTRQRSSLGSLKAIVAGSGPSLLLLHGVGLRAEAWSAQIDCFATNFRVMAADMAGHGETPPAYHLATLSDYTDRIATALNNSTIVIGHSMGALIALDLAIRYPSKVTAVGALNCIYRRSLAAKAAIANRVQSLAGNAIIDPTPTLKRWFGELQADAARACRRWLMEVDPASYKQAYAIFATEDGPGDEDLSRLAVPALFMTGARELNSTPSMSETMASLVPRGQSIIIDGAAHMMPITHIDAVNHQLSEFLRDYRT